MGIHGPHKRNTKPTAARTEVPAKLPDPPEGLGEAGKAAWQKLASELTSRVAMTAGDCALLAVVARLHDAWAECSRELESRPDPGSIRVMLNVAKQIQSGLGELGLTIRSKSAMGVCTTTPKKFPWGPGEDEDDRRIAKVLNMR